MQICPRGQQPIARRDGHEVQLAASGAEVLALVEHARPTVLVLDLTLPDLDGW